MNAIEISAKLEALTEIPQVVAKDMYAAQGWCPTAAERAAINAKSDFFEEMSMGRDVHVRVLSPAGEKIGELIFNR